MSVGGLDKNNTQMRDDSPSADTLEYGPKRRLDELFAEQVQRTPDAIALIHKGSTITYGQLDARANRLARRMQALGVGRETLVGVCLERSFELVIALLAVLKAGGAYVPLDPKYPADRLNFTLEDSAAPFLVTRSGLGGDLAYPGHRIDLDIEAAAIEAQPSTTLAPLGDADDLAYVIYTSGSTGQPKGVMLSHSAGAFFRWAGTTFTPAEMSRVAATTSVCFDPSVFELFAPLSMGAAAIIKENSLEPFTPDEQPTLLNGVPSAFAELARSRAIPDSVRIINIGGETFKPGLAQELYEASHATAIYNHYGPTEATTCTTVFLIAKGAPTDAALPIGKPIAGAILHVLDEDGQAVPAGEAGELYIAGQTVARGYLNRPELTAQKFVGDPNGLIQGSLYRTGDQVRWSAAGELEFLGRIDGQVKLHGFRIELGEIEAAMLRIPDVRKTAAVIGEDQHQEERLVAYVESEQELRLIDVRRFMGAWLPDYMLPSALVTLARFPLTPSGKVDRNALPGPDWSHRISSTETGYLPPVEEVIADTFQEVLGCGVVGRDDNFFELGGDSLLGVGVILKLELLLGQSIPPGSLFHGPTPKLLAAMLEQREGGESGYITALQPDGDESPLFCLPDIFGRPLSYVSLARRMAPNQPVFGLSPGPLEKTMIQTLSLRVLTKAYMAEIRKIQPHGPYRITGYSSGGVAAFDLAAALKDEGEDVLLILLDSAIMRRVPPVAKMLDWARRHLQSSLNEAGAKATAQNILWTRRIWFKNPKVVRTREVPEWVPRNTVEFARSYMQAEKNYQFSPFSGSTILVQCTQRGPIQDFLNIDGLLGWEGLFTGPLTRIDADIDHFKLMREPFVGELAARLHAATPPVRH